MVAWKESFNCVWQELEIKPASPCKVVVAIITVAYDVRDKGLNEGISQDASSDDASGAQSMRGGEGDARAVFDHTGLADGSGRKDRFRCRLGKAEQIR
jgi:hypothetical protein